MDTIKGISAFCTIIILALYAPLSAQLLGDVNCNGYPWEIADYVLMSRFMFEHCDLYAPSCPENSDFDFDGIAPTVGDILYMSFSNNPPDFPRHPQSDTLEAESTIAHPGESAALGIWISSVDTIMGLQFLLDTDTEYIQFDSLIERDISPLLYSNCDGNIYCVSFPALNIPVIDDPGNYHICDLIFTVNPDINQPIFTSLLFSSSPQQALYSGFANTDFFLPVLVDAEIEIVPLTDIETGDDIIPVDFEISAYPNPFNDAVNISVNSEHSCEITIYDIMGRPVNTFTIDSGNNLIRWDATDESGQALSAGVYFVGYGEKHGFKKVLYLK